MFSGLTKTMWSVSRHRHYWAWRSTSLLTTVTGTTMDSNEKTTRTYIRSNKPLKDLVCSYFPKQTLKTGAERFSAETLQAMATGGPYRRLAGGSTLWPQPGNRFVSFVLPSGQAVCARDQFRLLRRMSRKIVFFFCFSTLVGCNWPRFGFRMDL